MPRDYTKTRMEVLNIVRFVSLSLWRGEVDELHGFDALGELTDQKTGFVLVYGDGEGEVARGERTLRRGRNS